MRELRELSEPPGVAGGPPRPAVGHAARPAARSKTRGILDFSAERTVADGLQRDRVEPTGIGHRSLFVNQLSRGNRRPFEKRPNTSGGGAKGHLNYLNHVTGLHVNGPVDDVVVIATNPDGSPKTVRFSGTCGGDLPACSFSVTVEDNGEPGRIDEFGIRVTGALSEVRSQRIISRGNIQFH